MIGIVPLIDQLTLEQKIKNLPGPIFIFGASGFIGANMVEIISAVRDDYYASTHDSNVAWRLRLLNIPFDNIVHCDITSKFSVSNVFEKYNPKTVFNLAAYGAYSFTGCPTPCVFYDVWSGLTINGQSIPNVENQFILQPYTSGIQIGSLSREPSQFGFDFYGILQNEQILNTDIRKIGVTIKKAYTAQQMLLDVSAFYRVYVKEGTTEVLVQDWTPINRTTNEYYFIFDMRDKIPNQYYVDIQVNTSGEKNTYKKQLTFNIVNNKNNLNTPTV